MKQLSFSVRETADQLDENSGMYRYADTLFRPIKGRNMSMYEQLEDVFWRERDTGFLLPDVEVVEDASKEYWAGVEYVDGSKPRDELDMHSDEETVDDFFSSYALSHLKVIENPEKPFVWDVGMRQFLKNDDGWYLVDVEPRLAYLTDGVSQANSFYLSNVAKSISQHTRFTKYHHSLPETTRVLDELVDTLTSREVEHRWMKPSPIKAYGSVHRYKLRRQDSSQLSEDLSKRTFM